MLQSLTEMQNPDGGWPYRPGGSSWTEPTIFALLAGYASGNDTGRGPALEWLRSLQQNDGGWPPKAGVVQSTWVTALAALLPPGDLGSGAHNRAIHWLVGLTGENATLLYRLRSWLNGQSQIVEQNQGWPWFPGTAAWVTPTAMAILAFAKENRRRPDPTLRSRIQSARQFLFVHRCSDGGWNHGAAYALGADAPSYAETTGTALLAMAGADRTSIAPSITRAEAWWSDCPSSEAASWLMLGLSAAGSPKASMPETLKPRTVQDAALRIIANAGDRGTEIFLA